MKKNESEFSTYPLLIFQPFSSNLLMKEKLKLDSFAFFINKHAEFFENKSVVVTPFHSAKENDSNSFLGIDRFRTMIGEMKMRCPDSVVSLFYYNEKNCYFKIGNSIELTGLHIEIIEKKE